LHAAVPPDREPQGTFSGINATFVSKNPLNDPTLSSIASLTLYDLLHMVYLTGQQAVLCRWFVRCLAS
jgi:hypothetical protein